MEGRVKFDKETLHLVFSQLNVSPEELSIKTGAKLRAIKNWRTGSCTMPASFFEKLCSINPAIEKYESRGTALERNWGRVLGGKIRADKFSKEEIEEQMEKARSCITSRFQDIEEIGISDPLALEFYGIMMGDGCVSRYLINPKKLWRTSVVITGNSIKDREYFDCFLVPTMHKLFGTKAKPRKRKRQNTIDLVTSAAHVSRWLVKHGFPTGEKGELQIPDAIMLMSAEKKNNLIRGLFDTDGCVAARKDEGYKYPYVFIWSKSRKLVEQLKEILRGQRMPAYIHGDSVVLRGGNNFKIWFKKIGSSNPRNIKKYDEWLSTGKIIPKGL